MSVEKYEIITSGVQLKLKKGICILEGISDQTIRCLYTRKESAELSFSATNVHREAAVTLAVTEDASTLRISTPALLVEIDKETEQFRWVRKSDNASLLTEGRKQLVEKEVQKYTTNGEEPIIDRVLTVDGERNFVRNLVPHTDRMAYRGKLFFEWKEQEQIHGLGQGEEGIYNYRGSTQYLYQHNMRIPVPFMLSDQGYGIYFDCASLMTFGDDSRGSYLFMDTITQMDYYFMAGETTDEIIREFRLLTGDAVMLPKWAYGYIQSKEAYHTQEEMVEIAEKYRQLQIPLDCVVQDWNTWAPGEWGNKQVDKSRYPDLKAANDRIHELNVHTMVSVWPNMNSGTANHSEFQEAGLLLADFATYDAFSEEGRQMYWRQANEELYQGGFDSWWCDSTEPFSGPDWNGEEIREPWERFALVGEEHKKYLDAEKANFYAVEHAKGIYENQRKQNPAQRVLNLTRSGYATSQKYGAVLWSGDTCATWENFKKQITEGLNFCMSGMPYWTLDIGAFFTVKEEWKNRGCGCNTDPSPKWFWQGDYEQGVSDAGYRELYVRWLQYGVFLPMFRSHGTDTPREIWNFGAPGEPFYDAIAQAIKLRYHLMPYVYSMAGRVYLQQYTMLRSLLFDYAADPIAKELDSEFMFGDSLLVCPVTQPMYYERNNKVLDTAKRWRCYLPQGNDWYDYYTQEIYAGGQWLETEVDLMSIPLFVKAGSVLPTEQGLQYAAQIADTPLEFHIYPGADATLLYCEDAGEGYEYETGLYNQIAVNWLDEEKTLTFGAAQHSFAGGMVNRSCQVTLGDETKLFTYTGSEIKIKF
ncbi:MAG: TIM-barrel domain-containing protein [Lachnospiraceae bacterium]